MIKRYQDINHKTEEGKLLLIAIGTISAYAKHINKPLSYNDIIRDLKENEISIDAERLINKTFDL